MGKQQAATPQHSATPGIGKRSAQARISEPVRGVWKPERGVTRRDLPSQSRVMGVGTHAFLREKEESRLISRSNYL
ncbi:hypothetical protein D3C72_1195070 [compost metagenome]